MIRRLSFFLLMTVFSSGCATWIWVNPNKPKEAFYDDKLTCEQLANQMAWQRFPQSTAPITIQNTTVKVLSKDSSDDKSKRPVNETPQDPYMNARYMYHAACLSDCLHSKGWVRQQVKK